MDRWTRFVPLTGVVFVALLVATFIVSGSTPGSDESGAKVISFYKDHKNAQQASNALGAIAVVFLIFFAGFLRGYLIRSTRAAALAACGFGGAVLIGVGGAIFSSIGFALADVPDKLNPAAAQALNVLSNDFFFPLAAGASVFMIANGLAAVRSGLLPLWLGWIAVVLGVVSVTPVGFFAFLAVMLWVLIVSILLFIRGGRALPAVAAAT